MKRTILTIMALGAIPYLVASAALPRKSISNVRNGVVAGVKDYSLDQAKKIVVVKIPGENHEGEILIADRSFQPNASVKVFTNEANSREIL